jgi:capsular exopolysaccharide synthesis family protein
VERYVNAQDSRTGIVPTTLGIDDPVLSQLLQRLNNLELQLANLRTTTGENNPLLTSIENEIQTIRPNIKSIVDNQQARLAASRNNLISTSNRFEKNIRNIPQQERELLEISRQQAVKRELYSFLLQRREEAALSNQSTIADNRIIDWAEASVASVSSKRILVLAASLIAAFALGILYVIFKEIFNSKILFRSEIEKLTSTPVVAEIIFEKYSSPIIFQNKLNTAVAEQFRQMHVSLGWLNGQDRPASKQKALITSSMPNEGKTFISVNFAASLALSGKKVLLVDLNLRSPQTTVLFNFGQAKSIKDFLQGTTGVQEIIHKTQYEHLDVIPAGARTNNSLELLVQNKLNDLFKVLEQYYDYIIIDAPPVELATDAYILSQYCDVTLFVIRHQITPKAIVQRMDDNTRLEQIQNLKIIFNGIKGRGIVKKFYGYGYGYGKEKVFKDNIYANTE